MVNNIEICFGSPPVELLQKYINHSIGREYGFHIATPIGCWH